MEHRAKINICFRALARKQAIEAEADDGGDGGDIMIILVMMGLTFSSDGALWGCGSRYEQRQRGERRGKN